MFSQIDNMQADEVMEGYNPYMANNTPIMPNYYAEGGMVENEEISPLIALMGQNEGSQNESKPKADNNPYPSLAEMIRQQGEGDDTVLAHINPIEAEMLSVMSNGGSTNPVTGLPQFSFWSNPSKAFKSWKKRGGLGNLLTYGPLGALGIEMLPKKANKWVTSGTNKYVLPAAASMLGNTILPGLGGVIGGSLGGAAGGAHKGRAGEGAMRGAVIGATLPSAASLAGSGANALGMEGLGQTLTNYGEQNSIMKALGLSDMFGGSGGISGVSAAGEVPVSEIVKQEAAKTAAEKSFTDMLMYNSKNFFSQPQNLMTAAVLGGSLMNRPKPPKEKSPEELAEERKRYEMALMLTPEEQAAKEAADLAAEQSRRRVARNKFLPEERFNIEPLYVKTNSPEDYKRTGRWLEYYNNPQFSGSPIMMKEGGEVKPKISYEIEQFSYPSGLGFYVSGETKGQDDKIPAMLSDGEYVIPADTVAHLGDGNNNAGAKKLDEMIKKIRGSKGMKNALPPKAKSLTAYLGV